MKRLFSDRARIVVYLEQADVIRMTAKAREDGLTLVEWARETLRGELEIGNSEDVPRARAVRERRTHARNGGRLGEIEDIAHEVGRANGVNPVDSGTELGQGVPEDGVSTRTASPKSCDTASYVAAENPIQRLDESGAAGHSKGCACGVCQFKREVLK